MLSKAIRSFRRLLLRQRKDLLYRSDHCCPLSHLSCGSCTGSRLQRQGCNASPLCFRQEMRPKRKRYICSVSESHTLRKSGQCPAAGNVQHKRTGCLASGPAEAHCSCDPQAVTDSSCAITACKADTAAPCLHTPCSARASHHSSALEMWLCGTQR